MGVYNCLQLPLYPLDAGVRPESNACSGGKGEVPHCNVNDHLGNPEVITR
jgi:hypothetical protein